MAAKSLNFGVEEGGPTDSLKLANADNKSSGTRISRNFLPYYFVTCINMAES